MIRIVKELSDRHRPHTVFSDFCELSALSISNAVDKSQFDAREARYLQIAKGYSKEEMNTFPKLLAHLIEWLSEGMDDCLGSLFMLLELGNHWKGQYFTPFPVSQLMGRMLAGDLHAQIEREGGFVTVSEPCVGAGGMVIAMADAMIDQKLNYQQAMHVIATDVDATAAHMAYVQFSLLHIPAIVVHGNSLTVEEWGHWVTPAHVLGGWDRKLKTRRMVRAFRELINAPEAAGSATVETIDMATTDNATVSPVTATNDTEEPLIATRDRIVARRVEQMDLFG